MRDRIVLFQVTPLLCFSLDFDIPLKIYIKGLMKKFAALNGVFAVNKPIGWTSRDVVNRVQNVLTKSWCTEQNHPLTKKKVKMGHGGTLVQYSCSFSCHVLLLFPKFISMLLFPKLISIHNKPHVTLQDPIAEGVLGKSISQTMC
jgi:hypothetical protein